MVSDTRAKRDPIYSGKVIYEPCAAVLRVAPTFFRFGSFEIFKEVDPSSGSGGPSIGLKEEMLPRMLDYIIKNFYLDLWK